MHSIARPIRVPAIQFASAKVANRLLPNLGQDIILLDFISAPKLYDKVA